MSHSKTILLIFLFVALSANLSGRVFQGDTNIIVLKKFLQELKQPHYDKNRLYQDYMFIPARGEPDRSDEEKEYYRNKLFADIHIALKKGDDINILPLKQAKKELGDSIVEYDHYYDGQEDEIYFVWTTKKKKIIYGDYFLVTEGKIISLFGYVQDGKLFWWR